MSRLLALAILVSTALAAAPARAEEPISRDQIISLAKSAMHYSYWWGHGRWRSDGADHGSCSGNCPNCSHGGHHGSDCSGLAAKVWQVPGPIGIDSDAHPYSTYNFRNDTSLWTQVSRSSLKRGDAMVHNSNGSGHVFIFESGDGWGSHWAYECKGCAYGCVHDLRTASSAYVGIRRNKIDDRPALDAQFVGQGADVPADDQGKAQFKACTGAKFHYWFDLRDTGSADWVDDGAAGKSTGQDVRLGVSSNTPDPLTGTARASVSHNANPDVKAAGADCNDKVGCRRTVFKLEGTAPTTPGVHRSAWQLVDEGRAWFGPKMYLTFNVVTCAPAAQPDAGVPATSGDASTAVRADAGDDPSVEIDSGTPVAEADAGSPPSAKPSTPTTLDPGTSVVGPGCSASGLGAPSLFALLALAAMLTRRARKTT